ncbi:MAG: hypothetical protein DWQ07_17570 [Chloroflexi bacterium]|nr:MAG: hypothetical protein DWQ07_17570 [Chloroflexota bacterium]
MVTDPRSIKNKRGVLITASPDGLRLEGVGYADNSCALTINDLQQKLQLQNGDEDHKDTFYVQSNSQSGVVSQG